jgi:hypothetical protein
MMYTNAHPTYQDGRIYLFPSLEAAQAAGGSKRTPSKVAVAFDLRKRRVVPLWTHPLAVDPTWTALAEALADGSITAHGPIPFLLFAV